VEGLALLSPSGCAELTPFLHAMQEALGKVNDGRISRELVLGYAASTLPRNSGERASVSAAGVVAATCVIGEASMIADAQAARDGLAACRESLLANGWLILDFP
jgi:hypothetical protein